MKNAKQELLDFLEGKSPLICAEIQIRSELINVSSTLMQNYSLRNLKNFINNLDYDYDNGFGEQYLFGTLWFKDGTWATRKEHSGSEKWIYHKLPEMPAHLF